MDIQFKQLESGVALPTLYSYDSKKKTRCWDVHTDNDTIVISYGLVHGKKATQSYKAKPKNVGKSNETTAAQQAINEAVSRWTEQVEREDYHMDIEQSGKQLRPMLARDYTKVGHQVDWSKGWCVQPKLDGLRLVYGKRYNNSLGWEFLSRKGETYRVDHLTEELTRYATIIQEMGYDLRGVDGEIYVHGMPLNEINSRAKKYQRGLTEELEYHIFDLVMDEVDFGDRWIIIRTAFEIYENKYGEYPKLLKRVGLHNCTDELDMKEYHKEYAAHGYEGIMLRNYKSLYHMADRPACLYKYKEFQEAEFKIIDVWEDNNGNAMFRCANPNGHGDAYQVFDCTPKRTHKERKKILQEKSLYIGKWLTVKFQAWTEYGVPEFPVGLELRECNDNGEPIY
jgi:DNA ligase-1